MAAQSAAVGNRDVKSYQDTPIGSDLIFKATIIALAILTTVLCLVAHMTGTMSVPYMVSTVLLVVVGAVWLAKTAIDSCQKIRDEHQRTGPAAVRLAQTDPSGGGGALPSFTPTDAGSANFGDYVFDDGDDVDEKGARQFPSHRTAAHPPAVGDRKQ